MPTSRDIRQQFIDFFVKRHGHSFVPSSPVVPHNDPTLLFTNAGMNQFKPYFLGTEQPPREVGTRVVNTQKCIRAGGKHNDLEDVGKDTYHHTFFEMLGNWSFGDYFKKESIDWGWELLVNVWGLDPQRLHATYFRGDEADGLAPDDEARDIWLQYLPGEHIHPGNKEDNFWEMGDTGPCGPCSEIHYDWTPDKSGRGLVNAGDPRVIEIWNHVFIQFNRDAAGKLTSLPAKHIDTGMGFERICAVLQGKASNYDTDVFTPYFAAIADATGAAPYTGELDKPQDIAYRVIADHIRCLTFALADGAHCGNDGRNYVLRRILRRAVRYGRQTLNCHEPFFHKLVGTVAEQMGDVFPEVVKKQADVEAELREEEESFGKTLDRGIALFHLAEAFAVGNAYGSKLGVTVTTASDRGTVGQSADTIHFACVDPDSNKPVTKTISDSDLEKFRSENDLRDVSIRGEDAFKLHDTYGFPLDLTQLMAQERGMSVDVAGFNTLMEQARQRSRGDDAGTSRSVHDQLVEIVQSHGLSATEFLGYDTTECTRQVELRAFELPGAEGKVAVVTSATPFYAEAGGQVGDTGVIQVKGGPRFTVEDTQKVGDVFFHIGSTRDPLPPGVVASATTGLAVDKQRRAQIMANHTVTHVMNRALRCHVNPEADQKGSLVDPDKTRFDFSHPKAVTPEQVEAVERQVNADIAADLPVYWGYAPQAEALKINGLRAVFGEKYPPTVRVVAIGKPPEALLKDPANPQWANLSIEFCGGTHLRSTGEAEAFTIISEEAVSKGVRRITALTGDKATEAIAHGERLLREVHQLADDPPADLDATIERLTRELDGSTLPLRHKTRLRAALSDLAQRVKQQAKTRGKQQQGLVVEKARAIADQTCGAVIVARLDDADANLLRTAMDVVRKRHGEAAILLAGAHEDKVAVVAACPPEAIARGLKAGDWVRQAAQVCGGGGGGKPEQAAAGGKDVTKIDEALEAARRFAAAKLQ